MCAPRVPRATFGVTHVRMLNTPGRGHNRSMERSATPPTEQAADADVTAPASAATGDTDAGPGPLAALARRLPAWPGVYRLLDAAAEVLYVGKAADLRRRVASYFVKRHASARIGTMVRQVADIQVTVTASEAEALLLENTLIKTLKPRYNVMLRDDKSYPYIYVSAEEDFPRIAFHRGARSRPGRYFGPYPSAGAVRESLALLQRTFPVRQCEDHYFRTRSRPCLQYQMHRCTAPCVGYVGIADYAEDVRGAELFLEGRDRELIEMLAARMHAASAALDYEGAARLRDQIAALRRVQEKQAMDGRWQDADVIACALRHGRACVYVVYVRGGRVLGDRAFFPSPGAEETPEAVVGAFVAQAYLDAEMPAELILSHAPEDHGVLREALSEKAGRRVRLAVRVRGDRARWLEHARANAALALGRRLAARASLEERFAALARELDLPGVPARIECFDISHTMGEAPVASCVVFGPEGAIKEDYRRFNIRDVTAGDDYAAMAQAVARRYGRAVKESGRVPEMVLIDGGAGQLAAVLEAVGDLDLDGITWVAVAKGVTRRPGAEVLLVAGRPEPFSLTPDSAALHLIQQVRDEAHRFAIAGHRARRGKARRQSPLEAIRGLGPRRRQALLTHFGGMQRLARAGLADLKTVPGISDTVARAVYEALHEGAPE
jgi:excinuclease ABC subunit C